MAHRSESLGSFEIRDVSPREDHDNNDNYIPRGGTREGFFLGGGIRLETDAVVEEEQMLGVSASSLVRG